MTTHLTTHHNRLSTSAEMNTAINNSLTQIDLAVLNQLTLPVTNPSSHILPATPKNCYE